MIDTKSLYYLAILFVNSFNLVYLLVKVKDSEIGVFWTLTSSFTVMLVIFLISQSLVWEKNGIIYGWT